MLTFRKRRIFFWASVAVFIILTPVILLYALGFRLTSNFQLEKTGGLYISSPISGSEIYIDGELVKRTNLLQSGVFVEDLTPKDYHIIVAANGYITWSKRLRVNSQYVTEAKALLIPSGINASIALKTTFKDLKYSPFDPMFILVENKKNKNVLSWYYPEINQFFSSSSGAELSYKNSFEIFSWQRGGVILKLDSVLFRIVFNFSEGTVSSNKITQSEADKLIDKPYNQYSITDSRNVIHADYDKNKKELTVRWSGDTIPPYYLSKSPETVLLDKNIRSFSFYPSRRDVLIASIDNGVWAVELDGRSERNVYLIYKGKNPDFGIVPGNAGEIYILDGGLLIQLSLFAKE